jgi:hypothetical protein
MSSCIRKGYTMVHMCCMLNDTYLIPQAMGKGDVAYTLQCQCVMWVSSHSRGNWQLQWAPTAHYYAYVNKAQSHTNVQYAHRPHGFSTTWKQYTRREYYYYVCMNVHALIFGKNQRRLSAWDKNGGVIKDQMPVYYILVTTNSFMPSWPFWQPQSQYEPSNTTQEGQLQCTVVNVEPKLYFNESK